ncbi:translation initiation factor IF-2 [bacterium]|nr:translation initiation factor IF-2 [candidate division CSSED10-310 bacterium]
MKVSDLAKELGVTGKDLLARLKKEGLTVKKQSDELDDDTVALMRDEYGSNPEQAPESHTSPIEPEPRQRIEVLGDEILLEGKITVMEFASALKMSGPGILQTLIKMGKVIPLTATLDDETAEQLAEKLGYRIVIVEETPVEDIDQTKLQIRPPVVTVMGHVDHGKTTLLDAIRATQVAEREAGGITQHIGASYVDLKEGRVVFLDTPGHEAFTQLRARGASVTDIVILIVAADDGVMPQTIEAINHARAAGVPIIVAINKIDKPNADVDRVKNSLVAHNLVPEEWGGSTQMVEISAKQRIGITELLEMILIQSEVMDLKTIFDAPAEGIVIESRLDKGKGPVATVLINRGTLRIGDAIVSGIHSGKIRALIDWQGKNIPEATPSTPVEVLGMTELPSAGDSFLVVSNEKVAREMVQQKLNELQQKNQPITTKISFEDLFAKVQTGAVKELKTVVKSDVQGSLEAIEESLVKMDVGDVKIKIIHKGVGSITDNDINLASASNAVVIGFNVRATSSTRKLAAKEHVEIRTYRIIYDLINDIKAALEGMLEPVYQEVVLGTAEVRQVFHVSKMGTIAGSYVTSGKIRRAASVRVLRENNVLWEGKIAALRRFKDDAKEVTQGYECGISLENYNDIQVGDIIECFGSEEVARS